MNYNPMSIDDYEAILWLEEESKKMPALMNAWIILKKYYEECKNYLKNIDTNESPFESVRERDRVYSTLSEIINNDYFMSEVEDFFGFNKEKIENIINNKDYSLEANWIIAKTVRLYNMHLKLGHSARITYVAESGLENIEVDNKDILDRTVLLSALLHDVGRFYQAAHYNDLADYTMKKKEDKIGDLEVDHAIAGYYYSLASALELHKLVDCSQDEDVLRYVTEAVAATVVKCHQKRNSDLDYFDYDGLSDVLRNPQLIQELYQFMDKAYENAKLMSYDVNGEIDSKHKEFIDRFIDKIKTILYAKELDFSPAEGFDISESDYLNDIYVSLDKDIHTVLRNMRGMSTSEVSEKIVNVLNAKVKELSHEEFNDDEKKKYKKDIEDMLSGMLNYDVSTSIEEMFKNGVEISDAVRYLISTSMSMTMDADKIDILNQRALGIYNVGYKLSSIDIFPPNGQSLREIFNNYFHFNLPSDRFVIDDNMISIIKKMDSSVIDMINRQLGDVSILSLPEGSQIVVTNDAVTINGVNHNGNELYKMFNTEWNSYLKENMNLEDLPFKEFKKKYFKELQITVPTDILKNNLKDASREDLVSAYKKLVVSEGLDKRFMLEGVNGIAAGWIHAVESEDADHLVNGPVSALLWQLNQFVMVNIRNKHSLEFIESHNILDQINEQYQEKDPIVAAVIKDYIDYTKGFIKKCLEMVKGDNLTGDMLAEIRREYYDETHNMINRQSYNV